MAWTEPGHTVPARVFPVEVAIMSARDKYHDAVKNALIRDGWSAFEARLIAFEPQEERIVVWIEMKDTGLS